MATSPLFITPNALANNAVLDAVTAKYAVLADSNFTPTEALATYADLTSASTGSITGATNANPVVITAAAHGRTSGDQVDIASVGGMTQLNGNTYKITVIDANSYSLQDGLGNNIDGTGFGAYTSGGTWTLQYEIKSYADYAQVALTSMAIINTALNNKGRALDAAVINFGATVSLAASWVLIFEGTAGSASGTDVCVGWAALNCTVATLSACTLANPGSVTSTGHAVTSTDTVAMWGSDMPGLNNNIFTATSVDANTFTIGVDTSAELRAATMGNYIDLASVSLAQSSGGSFTVDFATAGAIGIA
jgi:hypothetical protein